MKTAAGKALFGNPGGGPRVSTVALFGNPVLPRTLV
jgi:hypothetical protein